MKQIMLKKTLLQLVFFIFCATYNVGFSQKSNLGVFTESNDIGACNIKGNSVYNSEKQEYTLSGSGANMWLDKDAFHFLHKKMKGDFILQFEYEFVGKVKNPYCKVGWMVRNDTTFNSAHISVVVHNNGATDIQYRLAKGATTLEKKVPSGSYNIIQLERRGNHYILSVAVKNQEFTTVELVDSIGAVNNDALVGIFLCSHEKELRETAIIRNVRITVPVASDYKPNKGFIGSNLEIMDIESGSRKIVYTTPSSVRAPNWTTDGKSLIYNCDGKLYNFDIVKGIPTIIDTKFAIKNNNDHALSFDGKWIGISNSSESKEGQSQVFLVPLNGGTPELITEKAPSYFHGFSPDGKTMLFTGGREEKNNFEIYSINIKTKEEKRLTNSPGLDDGSEFSPDGKYIYFNSVRSGKMQIWRILPDGSNPERMTLDEMNNWFPHISPNGKYMVYLAYGNDVLPGDHPFYKHVSIRLMNLETRETKILAHLYGGQGTINVPSWSPDSKKFAFVSNTDLPEWNSKCY